MLAVSSLRRPASRLAFALGCLLLGGAALTLLAARVLPSEGFQDLGRIVTALLLAALAAPLFLAALLVGRGTGMPRWMLVASIVGAALGVVPAVAILSVRF